MILQALTQYYERQNKSEPGLLPEFGFGDQKIPLVIEINEDGKFHQLVCRDQNTEECVEKVPAAIKRASNVAANLLWDTVEYCLGIDTRGKPERVEVQHQAFLDRIDQLNCQDKGITALKSYLNALDVNEFLDSHEQHKEFLMKNPNMSFRLLGDPHLVCQRPGVIKAIRESVSSNSEDTALCLVSGIEDAITRLHPPIKGVWGAQSSGANIVSFNLDASESYGKEQGYNSPVGEKASFAYTTALNHLLRKGSDQRVQVGDASTVFWSEKETNLENDMSCIFGSTPKQIKDDPDKYTNAVKAVYESVKKGRYHGSEEKTKFYVLGLSPNASRLSIRFWHVTTVRELSERIKRHFDDLSIVHANFEQEYLPLFSLLLSVAVQGKSENIPPNLAGSVMRSILTGTSYPYSLLAAAVCRNKAEQKVTYPRAAIIKAYINRHVKEEIKMALDTDNLNHAYRLGRLFAALEKVQEEAADSQLNTTIRDRYYGAASSSPVSVFSTLIKLKNHHLAKLKEGRKIYFEKLIGEIILEIPGEFPTNLGLIDQGCFAVGYYHQRQDFFTSHKTTE